MVCLAPRAREESVRSRRLGRACARPLKLIVRAPRVPTFEYKLLQGRISDQRVFVHRYVLLPYTWDFAVDDTPVTLVAGGNGVIDTIAKGRHVVVAGRWSLLGRRRLLVYRLLVGETGITAGIKPAAAALPLLVQIASLLTLLAIGEWKTLALLAPLLAVGIPPAALVAYDAYRCSLLMKVVGSHASA